MQPLEQQPAWVSYVQEQYDPQIALEAESRRFFLTSFRRCFRTAEFIESLAPGYRSESNPFSVMLIGAGMNAGPIIQPYEAYLTDARLTSTGIPHRIHVIDRDARPLSELRNRRSIYLPQISGLFNDVEEDVYHWKQFLEESGQTEELVYEETGELTFLPDVAEGSGKQKFGKADYLDVGFRKTGVPASFVRGLATGAVRLVQENIVTADPNTFRSADLIVCFNVLYLVPEEAQAAALWNMSGRLPAGAQILLNDFTDMRVPSMLTEYGGWMSPEMLNEDFSLSMRILYRDWDLRRTTLLLTKI